MTHRVTSKTSNVIRWLQSAAESSKPTPGYISDLLCYSHIMGKVLTSIMFITLSGSSLGTDAS